MSYNTRGVTTIAALTFLLSLASVASAAHASTAAQLSAEVEGGGGCKEGYSRDSMTTKEQCLAAAKLFGYEGEGATELPGPPSSVASLHPIGCFASKSSGTLFFNPHKSASATCDYSRFQCVCVRMTCSKGYFMNNQSQCAPCSAGYYDHYKMKYIDATYQDQDGSNATACKAPPPCPPGFLRKQTNTSSAPGECLAPSSQTKVTTTCGEVKAAYKHGACCDHKVPSYNFSAPRLGQVSDTYTMSASQEDVANVIVNPSTGAIQDNIPPIHLQYWLYHPRPVVQIPETYKRGVGQRCTGTIEQLQEDLVPHYADPIIAMKVYSEISKQLKNDRMTIQGRRANVLRNPYPCREGLKCIGLKTNDKSSCFDMLSGPNICRCSDNKTQISDTNTWEHIESSSAAAFQQVRL